MTDSVPEGSDTNRERHGFFRMVTGAGILSVSRIMGDMASALLFIGISRVYGVEGTGIYSYAFAVAQIAFILIDFGLIDYTMREYASAGKKAGRQILAHAILLQLIMTVIVAFALWGYLLITGTTGEASAVVWILTAYLVLAHTGRMLFIPAFTEQRMVWPAVAEVCFRVGGTLVAFAFILLKEIDLARALSILPVAAGIMVLCVTAATLRFARPLKSRFQIGQAVRILRESIVFAGSSLLTGLLAKTGILLLTFLVGITATGMFATGLKLMDFSMVPLLFLGIAVYPRLARGYQTDPDDLYKIADQYVRLSFTLGALACWGMVFIAPPLLPRLLGEEFAATALIVQLGGLAALVTALDLASIRILWSFRLQHQRLRIQTIGVVASVLMNLVMIPWLGAEGAMLAAILTPLIMLSLAWKPIRSQWPPQAWNRLISACALPGIIGLTTGASALSLPLHPVMALSVPFLAFLLSGTLSGLFHGVIRRPSSFEITATPGDRLIEEQNEPVLVLSPHYDDESLGCGGTIAKLAERTEVHVLFFTDGRCIRKEDLRANIPETEAMPEIRLKEALNASEKLGLPAGRVHTLSLPDGDVSNCVNETDQGLREYLHRLKPSALFVPFRYDQHPDHLAVYRSARKLQKDFSFNIYEYFVYNRYPWLPKRDIRHMICPSRLISIDVRDVLDKKRTALREYTSQVTCFLPHQTRPVLGPELIDEQCTGPEIFLEADEKLSDRKLFKEYSWMLYLSTRYGFRIVRWKKKIFPAPVR